MTWKNSLKQRHSSKEVYFMEPMEENKRNQRGKDTDREVGSSAVIGIMIGVLLIVGLLVAGLFV